MNFIQRHVTLQFFFRIFWAGPTKVQFHSFPDRKMHSVASVPELRQPSGTNPGFGGRSSGFFLLPRMSCTYWSSMEKTLWKSSSNPAWGGEGEWASVSACARLGKHDVTLICTARGWAHRGGVLQIYSCANSSLFGLTFSKLPPWTKQQALRYELFKGLWELLPNKIEHQWKTKESTL